MRKFVLVWSPSVHMYLGVANKHWLWRQLLLPKNYTCSDPGHIDQCHSCDWLSDMPSISNISTHTLGTIYRPQSYISIWADNAKIPMSRLISVTNITSKDGQRVEAQKSIWNIAFSVPIVESSSYLCQELSLFKANITTFIMINNWYLESVHPHLYVSSSNVRQLL